MVARLQSELPELCVLGDFNPAERTGPAIWLRLVIADKSDEVKLPNDKTPILYLPGVRRQDLRAVSECPEHLKPLAELQYRGVIWSQVNSKDWTIAAFLQSSQGGLGLDVAQDNEAKSAMRLALFRLLDERIDLLDGKHLDKDYFFGCIGNNRDTFRNILMWIDNPSEFREQCDTNAWNAFTAICKSQLKFDPNKDGELEAAERLAEKAPPWDSVWQRFTDAPRKYPNIPAQIRKTKLPLANTLFPDFSGWPQWNDRKESELRESLKGIDNLAPGDARKKIHELDGTHGARRQEVWAELGMSPLCGAEARGRLGRAALPVVLESDSPLCFGGRHLLLSQWRSVRARPPATKTTARLPAAVQCCSQPCAQSDVGRLLAQPRGSKARRSPPSPHRARP